jgi:glycosyltransferase involved in cell wall biosynthesis
MTDDSSRASFSRPRGPSSAPRVSICLPTLGAEADLARLLPRLLEQRVSGGCELVVVDSDSRDCTRQLLRRAGARVVWIPRSEFGHAATRNRLAELARGEVLVFLSQDALPADGDFVERLIAPLLSRRAAGATARVLPRPEDDPLTQRTALAVPEAGDEAAELRSGLAGGPRFNNVASAIRAETLAELPFPDVPFGEDLAWAEAALARGERLEFVPSAVVYHAHTYTPAQAFARNRVDAVFLRRSFGLRLRTGPWSVLRGVLHELREDLRHVARHGGWLALPRAPALRCAQVAGQWFGSRGPAGPKGTGAAGSTR